MQMSRQKKSKVDAMLLFWYRSLSMQNIIRICMLTALVSSAWMNGYKSSQSFSASLDHDLNRERRDEAMSLQSFLALDRLHKRSILASNVQVDDNVHPVLYYKSDAFHSVHVVISHCNVLIDWIWDSYLKGLTDVNRNGKVYSIKSVTILSKCGFQLNPKEIPLFKPHPSNSQDQQEPPPVNVLSLPNVGRCDHSYAYWIKSMLSPDDNDYKEHKVLYSNTDDDDPFQRLSENIDKKDLVLFMKDNDNKEKNSNYYFKASDMFEEALYHDRTENFPNETKTLYDARNLIRGVGCGLLPGQTLTHTSWYHRSVTWRIVVHKYPKPEAKESASRFRSKYWPMGLWIQSLAFYSFPDYFDPQNMNYDASLPPPTLPRLPPSADSNPVFSEEYMEHVVQLFNQSNQIPTEKSTKKYREPDLVPVCYGGVFTALWGQLSSEDAPITRHGWKVITHALSRENNIEEGHYMERWWAELFAWSSYGSSINNGKPRKTGEFLSEEEQSILFKYKYNHIDSLEPFAGALWIDAMMLIQNNIIDPTDKAVEVVETLKTNKIQYHRVNRKKKKPAEGSQQ